jgi:hypothetical protein
MKNNKETAGKMYKDCLNRIGSMLESNRSLLDQPTNDATPKASEDTKSKPRRLLLIR